MNSAPAPVAPNAGWTRRSFLGTACLTGGALLTGCATNPVTGRRQLMLMSERGEIEADREFSPHQFSADYGPLRDPALQAYLEGVGETVSARSHRPHMPYSFRALHTSAVNAYTFPAGSVGVTRGILLEMQSEAALAALLGHEVGHVAARHNAARMSMGILGQILVLGLGAAIAVRDERYAPLAVGLGAVGAGILLASYSRDNEREADQLGMEYMVQAGYNPSGMIELMDVLMNLGKRKPNAIERMFASHPMSDRRHRRAESRARVDYAGEPESFPLHRERYMDMTASVRARRPLIESVQAGDEAMMSRNWNGARDRYREALRHDAADYEALLKFAKYHLARNQPAEARRFAEQARAAYPEEPQAYHVRGLAALQTRAFDLAAGDFDAYLARLPGNPMTFFFSGLAYEGLGRRAQAIERFQSFLAQVSSGDEAEYARTRLIEWKVLQPANPA